MSAAGRGRHDGGDTDFYPTPPWCVDRLLDNCGEWLLAGVRTALEPTVGDGAIVRAFEAWRARHAKTEPLCWTGVELRRDALDPRTPLHCHVEGLDFRTWADARLSPLLEARPRFDLCAGNPPFALFEPIAERAIRAAYVTTLLLRVSVLEAEERIAFWRGVGRDVALRVLPERPSFDGVGTDSCAYAWFVWNHPHIRGVEVLDSTPIGVRKAQRPTAIEAASRQCSLFGDAGGDAA